MHRPIIAAIVVALLLTCASMRAFGWPGSGRFAGGGASTPALSMGGPASGIVNIPSSNFTISLSATAFNGSDTVTINDGSLGGTFTPSVGSAGVSTVIVTPTNGTNTFTFTYTPVVINGAITITVGNAQAWPNPPPAFYASNPNPGCGVGKADFSTPCGAVVAKVVGVTF